MKKETLDWLDANIVVPPHDPTSRLIADTTVSNKVILKLDNGKYRRGFAIYEGGKFNRWDFVPKNRKVTHWAYFD